MRWVILAFCLSFARLACATGDSDPCPPADFSRAQLAELRKAGYALEDAAARNALALHLLACLDDADPVLRDQIAYEALSRWMRAKALTDATLQEILERLSAVIEDASPDERGFHRPFAALILSEVARADRITPFMSNERRHRLVRDACSYMRSIRDYRGFDAGVGWRHGVAHTSDLMVQLAVNAAVPKDDLDEMLDAIATQVTPPGEHFYVYGEGERLARAVFYIAGRHLHDRVAWQSWMVGISNPAPFVDWDHAFESQSGLAKRHNLAEFLQSLYVDVDINADADVKRRIGVPLMTALKRIA
jgi:Protein of unknown function (DUF2785)